MVVDNRVYDRKLSGSFPQNVLTNLSSLYYHYEIDYVRTWLQRN